MIGIQSNKDALILCLIIIGSFMMKLEKVDAGASMSGMLIHDDNDALAPWRDFENSYNILFATEGPAQTPGATRDFIQLTMQQIPSYTRNTGLTKNDIDLRKGTSKLVSLMNQIPEIGNGKKECKLQELSQRIVFETIFAPNVHVNSFLKYYNALYYNFCINDIDREIIKVTAKKGLDLPDKFDDMKTSQSQAAKDLPQANPYSQIARGLILYLKSNKHNVERSGDKPTLHLKRINKLINEEIVKSFKCEDLQDFELVLQKYRLVSNLKGELSDDSRKWIDVIDLCDKVYNLSKQFALIDLYEIEAARLSTIIFMPANNPEFQHHNPENVEDDLKLIIDVLNAKKRLYREDHRLSVSKLEEVKFTLGDVGELCTLINVQKLQSLLNEYAGYPNVSNYLLHKAKMITKKCKDKFHAEILEKSSKLYEDDVKKLTSLRLRIVDASEEQFKKRLHNRMTVESFVEGTMAFLLSNEYQKEDGFDIIARYLAPKTTEERQTMREGAYMLLGELCDEVEGNFAKIHELFNEFDKLGDDSMDFDEDDRDWMANVNICGMIKFLN